ncbi:MAG TPA: phosphoribosylformylglycinamidine synthase subunit PurS, partial [Acidimicrobiales bacterium]|nr:phosphoribosylformylglycinamidine synthase subunit PurS [Acidimicrobiales bacterium]
MNYPIIVDVTLREGIADPEGTTIERALPALGFTGVAHVRTGKTFRFGVEAEDESAALATARSLAERL